MSWQRPNGRIDSSFDSPRPRFRDFFWSHLDKVLQIQIWDAACVCEHPFDHSQLLRVVSFQNLVLRTKVIYAFKQLDL